MEQNRFKSPVFWICTAVTIVYIALQKLGMLDANGIDSGMISNIGSIIAILSTVFNGINNPTNKTGL